MTLPNERISAVRYAREFLRELLDPKATPKVPRSIRKRAYVVLRHFPGDLDIRLADDELMKQLATSQKEVAVLLRQHRELVEELKKRNNEV